MNIKGSILIGPGRLGAGACLLAAVAALVPGGRGLASDGGRPNVVVILSDDQGYADVGFNPRHPPEVATPRIDALARSGVRFAQGYVSGNVCSPTRAGLMTGRYQQRAGIYTGGEGGSGLPLEETIFPEYLKPAGYVGGAFGKWHLGLTEPYGPVRRGFDSFYGFLGRGAHDYFRLDDPASPLYRDLEPIADEGYLTTRLTDEAVAFIRRHKDRPFFLYLAYNAVHAPPQAPEDDVKDFDTGDPARDVLMAMLRHLDDGVGRVVAALEDEGVFGDTLLFFLTDNGGSRAMHANNAPLRGFKQQNYEGGIRTPFLVSWPSRFAGGRTIAAPVISLDILPTALAAAGVAAPSDQPFDGKDLLPLIRGEVDAVHDHLFWSEGGSTGEWAVRSGDWKLVATRAARELFDLAADPAEGRDLATDRPEVVARLEALYDAWLSEMAEPLKGDPKRWEAADGLTPRERLREERRQERTKARQMARDRG